MNWERNIRKEIDAYRRSRQQLAAFEMPERVVQVALALSAALLLIALAWAFL